MTQDRGQRSSEAARGPSDAPTSEAWPDTAAMRDRLAQFRADAEELRRSVSALEAWAREQGLRTRGRDGRRWRGPWA